MNLDPGIRIRHIRCFLEVARLGNLADAAGALHVTQPAVSKTLKELELALGADLFDRSRRKMRLNEAGRIFQQHGATALSELSRAQSAVRREAGRPQSVAIGALPTAASDLLPRAAIEFAREKPNCLVRISTGPNWLLLSQLREGVLDLVVGRMAQSDQMAGLTFEQLYVEDVVLVARPDHPLIGSTTISGSLPDYPLILPPKGAVISQTVRSYLVSIGIHSALPMFETVSLAFGRRAVQLSDAVWFISRGVVAEEIKMGVLGEINLRHPMLAGPVGISLRDDASINLERDAFRDVLRQCAVNRT